MQSLRRRLRQDEWQVSSVKCRRRAHQRQGAVLILVALMIVVILISAAISISIAWMELSQTEMQSATDAATRAAGEAIAAGLTLDEAREEAKQIAALNTVAGNPVILRDQDIVFGTAYPNGSDSYAFSPGGSEINAVRISGQQIGSAGNSDVVLPFAPLLQRRSFQVSKFATAMIEERDICIVIDRSGSMSRDDGGSDPSNGKSMKRIDALTYAIGEFRKVIDETDGTEKLSAAAYSSTSDKIVQLTFDYALFDSAVAEIETGGMTNIGAGIDDGADLLADPDRSRPIATPIMIVMTDGRHNQSRDPVAAAHDAMERLPRLRIYTVTFSPSADVSRMKAVADIGNGEHFHANNLNQLKKSFEYLAQFAGSQLIE